MIVEELISKLGLEVDPEAFKTLEEFQHAIHHGIGIAVGAAALAFAALLGETAEAAVQMGHVAEVLDMNVEHLGELKTAADRSELSFEGLTTGLKHLGRGAAEAAAGSTEMRTAFAGIALRGADGKIKPVADLLDSVAEKFNKLPTAAARLEMVTKIFGRAGPEMIPFLRNMEEGIKKAREFGTTFSEEDVEGAKTFVDGTKDIRDSLIGLRNAFAVPFLRPFGEAFTSIAHVIASTRPYVAKFGLAMRQVAAEFWAVIKPIRMLIGYMANVLDNGVIAKIIRGADSFSLLKAVMLGLAVVAGILATNFIIGAASAIGAWISAAAPFVLLGALIGFIVDDIYNFIKGNDSLIGRIQKWADAIGSPDEHPMVRMLRKALALLLDVTNPQRWDEFKKAAGAAVDFVGEKIRVALGGKKAGVNGEATPLDQTDAEQNFVTKQGGLLDKLGFHRAGYERAAQTVAAGAGAAPGVHLQGNGQNFTPGPNVTNHITIQGSGLSQEQLQSTIEDALSASYSSALPAVSGGEK